MKATIKGEYLNKISSSVQSVGRSEFVIELRDNHWLIKCQGPASVVMTAIFLPDSQMESYNRGDYEMIGLHKKYIDNFVKSADSIINLEMESRSLHMEDESSHAKIATIDPAAIDGHMDSTINVEYEVTLQGDISFIFDFIKRGEEITGSDSFMVGVRENGVYLYMTGDSSSYDDFASAEEFDTFEYDWSINNSPEFGGLKPAEDRGIDVLLSSEFAGTLNLHSDEATVSIGNHHPMKYVFDELGHNDGAPMKVSYIQTPRLDKTGDMRTLPDEVLKG